MRIGVLGAGVQGKLHAQTLAGLAEVELAGVADLLPDNRRWAHETLGVPVYDTLDELLPHVDALSICLPDHLHEQPTIAALDAGAHVLLEKPMALSTDACDRIAARVTDRTTLMIGHVLRFDPRVIRAKELIDAGAIGDVWDLQVWRCTSQAVGEGIWDRTGVHWFLGIHDVDLVRFLTGQELEVLSAVAASRFSQQADVVHSTLRLSGGGLVTMNESWLLPHSRPSRADAGVKIVGERGLIEIDLSHSDLLLASRDGEVSFRDTRFWPSPSGAGAFNLRTELQEFIRSVRDGMPSPVTAADGRAAVATIEQIDARLTRAD
ncbi:Gfo/Idh/MocA family oxidoreductase [Pseudolysinimonas kribbensis]|uniref:Gfo/Idh/MocA family protein n=2 Tax=Pseudolysinimonas kribbensis TaxID=433641 RepID=UPI0031DA3320